jgi:hypothetical protein
MEFYQQQIRIYTSGDSKKNMTGFMNSKTNNRKIIDYEKNRKTLIYESGKIQDQEIMLDIILFSLPKICQLLTNQ